MGQKVWIKPWYVLFIFSILFHTAGHTHQRKTVLVVQSYHATYKWDADYTRAINDIIGNSAELNFFQMNTKRLPKTEHSNRAEAAWNKYLQLSPDLVILGDDNALKLLGPRFAKTNTPVIYLGINNNPRNYFTAFPHNISGVVERPLMKRSILLLDQILGKTLKKVLILLDSGTTSQTILKETFKGEKTTKIGTVEVQVELIEYIEEWHKIVLDASTQGFDAVIIGLYHTITTPEGKHIPEQEVIEWTSANIKSPLFAFWEFSVGKDMAIGGFVLDGYTHGKLAASMALKVLTTNSHHNLPRVETSNQGQFVFSLSQLSKWNITLPPFLLEKAVLVP